METSLRPKDPEVLRELVKEITETSMLPAQQKTISLRHRLARAARVAHTWKLAE